jgi:hypothetical protein
MNPVVNAESDLTTMAPQIITHRIDIEQLSGEGSKSDVAAVLADYTDRVQALLPAHVQFIAREATPSHPPTDRARQLASLGVDSAACWAQSVAFAWEIA